MKGGLLGMETSPIKPVINYLKWSTSAKPNYICNLMVMLNENNNLSLSNRVLHTSTYSNFKNLI